MFVMSVLVVTGVVGGGGDTNGGGGKGSLEKMIHFLLCRGYFGSGRNCLWAWGSFLVTGLFCMIPDKQYGEIVEVIPDKKVGELRFSFIK